MSERFDIAVVGAGVFGAWATLGLARRGQRVLLIEAWEPGHSRSSSGDESRIVRAGYGLDALYTRLALRSLAAWRGLDDRAPAPGSTPLFRRTGVLWFGRAADDRVAQTAATLAAEGAPHERLGLAELNRRYPQFCTEGIAWGLLEPESGAVLARRSVAHVVALAQAAGARLERGRVTADEPASGPPRLSLDGQPLRADRVVLACGPWLPALLPELLGRRIAPTRQEVFYLGVPPGDARFAAPALPAFVDFAEEIYAIPDLEGRGVKVGLDAHGAAIDPDTADRAPDLELLARVRERLARRLPALAAAPLVESRVCQYENTSNGDLLVDAHPADPGLWLVGGGSGHGFKHAPAIADHLVERMLDAAAAEPRWALASKLRERRRAVY